MSDFIYYFCIIAISICVPVIIVLTVLALAKPHIVNNRRKNPLSRKKMFAVGIVSLFISFFGFGIVSAATMPASVKAEIAAEQAAADKAKTAQEKAAQDSLKPVTKTVTSTESIPFTSSTQTDNSLPSGQTKESVKGVNGVKTNTYDVTYLNGKETSRKQTSSIVTTQPINQILIVGTYVAPSPSQTESQAPVQSAPTDCPNGTYVNSAGSTVCSPYSSSSAPAGATAQCRDGTYSFSQSRSGTCSHHGGVSTWL